MDPPAAGQDCSRIPPDAAEPSFVPTHLLGLGLIMAAALLGTLIPLAAEAAFKHQKGRQALAMDCAKLFGGGVILATAWVHMFSPADKALTDPCVPAFFRVTFPSASGALALLAALFVHAIQVLASLASPAPEGTPHHDDSDSEDGDAHHHHHHHHHHVAVRSAPVGETTPLLMAAGKPAPYTRPRPPPNHPHPPSPAPPPPLDAAAAVGGRPQTPSPSPTVVNPEPPCCPSPEACVPPQPAVRTARAGSSASARTLVVATAAVAGAPAAPTCTAASTPAPRHRPERRPSRPVSPVSPERRRSLQRVASMAACGDARFWNPEAVDDVDASDEDGRGRRLARPEDDMDNDEELCARVCRHHHRCGSRWRRRSSSWTPSRSPGPHHLTPRSGSSARAARTNPTLCHHLRMFMPSPAVGSPAVGSTGRAAGKEEEGETPAVAGPCAEMEAPVVPVHATVAAAGGEVAAAGANAAPGSTAAALLLELGILSHSILIGAAAGVSSGADFWSLVAALMVHQGFEGVALSAVVMEERAARRAQAAAGEAAAEMGEDRETEEAKAKAGEDAGLGMRVVWTVLAYCGATPFGGILGMLLVAYTHIDAGTYLLVEGILDAASAGVLAYTALVNILQPHFASRRYRALPVGTQVAHLACLWVGAAVMTSVGIWA
ncbi:high-affinity Zn(2+) transporter zrt1 [Phlyctochytrium bullatum]|nr:high-affinity Zn(2+) transporter zrt1 [Phlyctochytrium bullatum]